MSSYRDMTGVLVLDQVTAVIKALFKSFQLNEDHPGNGQVFIAQFSEEGDYSWDSVLENLQELAETVSVEVGDDQDDEIKDVLQALARHFNASANNDLVSLIENGDFNNDADLDSLFVIAQAFDDGHGLKAYKTEAAWYCSKPRLFEFGGCGDFTGSHCTVSGSSDQIVALGERLEAALSTSDIDEAAKVLSIKVEDLLAGIYDEHALVAVRSKLAGLLVEPKTQYFAVTGRIPGDDEDTLHVFQVATREEAVASFEAAMWEDKVNAEAARNDVFKEHGVTVFVNAVVVSVAPILEA